MKNFTPLLLALFIFVPVASFAKQNTPRQQVDSSHLLSLSLRNEVRHSLETAFDFFFKEQQPDGSWKSDPAITSLVLYSFLLSPSYNPDGDSDAALTRGFQYLERFVKPDGGIYRAKFKNYTTAVALLALTETGRARYAQIIADAKKYLIEFQLDESEGYEKDHPFYGGIGYGGDDRPDLSNLHLALEAVKAAEDYEYRFAKLIPRDAGQLEKEERELGVHWQRALVFLARCQNVSSVNDMAYATDDGGFIYETGHYKPERSHSYGSMTYAGVKSLIYARVQRDDIRVRKALEWIGRHYTWEENPGFGIVSLYYYYMTASKCLATLGDDFFVDAAGKVHNWRREMLEKLISLQKEGGYWLNENGRYWENINDLATAYAVIAMKFALEGRRR